MALKRKTAAPERAALAGGEAKVAAPAVAASPVCPAPSVAAQTAPPPAAAAPGAGSYAGKPCTGLAGCPERSHLVRRLWSAAEQDIAAAEAHMARAPSSATPAKRFSALALTLDRLLALDRKAQGSQPAAGDADVRSPLPVDAECMARRIARKLRGDDAGVDRNPHA